MRILVTAGPTREPIDAVRFITSRSSGKMGYALARAAAERGHEVVLVSGPTALLPPPAARFIRVETAQEMLSAVRANIEACDALIMAAAVSDWRPANPAPRKLKKGLMKASLDLEPTPDILSEVAGNRGNRIHVGFAAETDDLIGEARRKLIEKRLDLIVANDVARPDSGFDSETNKAVMLSASGWSEDLPVMSKDSLAARIVAWVETRAAGGG